MQSELTRPIVGIENRTAQEVFDIMCDRFRAEFGNEEAPRYTTRRLHEETRKAEERGRQHEREAALSAAEPVACEYGHDNGDGTYSPTDARWPLPPHVKPHGDMPVRLFYAAPPAPSVAVKAVAPVDVYKAVGSFIDNDTFDKDHVSAICRAIASTLSAQVQEVAGWQDEDKLTPDEAWTILCETPDITSPEEYPDHALITLEQLRSYMERANPVPEGWQLVPKKPTDDMLDAALAVHETRDGEDDEFRAEFKRTYRAMLAAAPAKQEG